MKTSMVRIIITALAAVIISTTGVLSQTANCVTQKEYKPENTCMPCTLNTNYNIIVKNMLRVNEIYKMEDELNRMVESSDAYYKTYGNIKQWGFDPLDLDLKKLFAEMEKNPEKTDDLISWLEGILEDAGCGKTMAYDTRSEGVGDGGLQSVRSSVSSSTNSLTFPNYNGPAQLTFDCCSAPHWHPNDIVLTNEQDIDNQFNRFKSMFEDFKRLQQVQMQAVQQSAWLYQKYDKSSADGLKRLVNNSFLDVITNALGQSGVITGDQSGFINKMIKQYYETNDKESVMNAIRQTLGNDAADVLGFMFNNYTATDLLGSFGSLIREHPEKLKALQKLGGALKSAEWLGNFMNLVQIAESSVNIFFDTFLKLGGNSFVIKTQSELWCVTARYYYYAAQSLLSNAAALYKMKQTLQQMEKFFPNTVIPMAGLDSLTPEQAQQKMASTFGYSNVKGTMQGNTYTVQLPDGKQIVFVFGNYNCGKYVSYPKAEVTPGPGSPKNNSGLIVEPQGAFEGNRHYNADSSVVIIDNYNDSDENKPLWRGGFICGTGWSSSGMAYPYYNGFGGTEFVQQHQTELNNNFGGTVFAGNGQIKIITFPSAEAGFQFGCAVNYHLEINGEVSGGWFSSLATTNVKVVTIQMPDSPSAPPSTQQTTESISAQTQSGFLSVKLGPQANFGKHITGYVGAGPCAGFTASGRTKYIANDIKFSNGKQPVIPFYGGYINAGLAIPLSPKCAFKAGAYLNLLAVQKRFVFNSGVSIGINFKF